MSDAASALGALGSDLAFSVSFGVARELLEASEEVGMAEDELISIVLSVAVVFSAVPKTVALFGEAWASSVRAKAAARAAPDGSASDESTQGDEPKKEAPDPLPNGLGAFLLLLTSIAKRISISIAVQLLSSNVRGKQPLRSVRIISLLSVSVFFLFLEATSSIGVKPKMST
tara:strand:+ start:99 stop:614 length:516 start_codon:yes stop_codon:yes gene_type:complete